MLEFSYAKNTFLNNHTRTERKSLGHHVWRHNITFIDKNGNTEVLVDLDIADEWKEMFEGLWPKALAKLKEMCED